MTCFTIETLEIDQHRLALRFAALRVTDAHALETLTRSIERCGQLTACIAVAEGDACVLLDGYRRLSALRKLAHDTILIELWHCPLADALPRVLACALERPWAPIEEALLLRELVTEAGLSQHELARRTGRDVSWVNRRLALVNTLTEELLDAICRGQLSTWAASRILAPLARANAEHARTLLGALAREPLSTRALKDWYRHYVASPRVTRERLVSHPHLFVATLAHEQHERAAEQLRDGPVARLTVELERITRQLTRLRRALPARLVGGCPVELSEAWLRARRAFTELEKELVRHAADDLTRVAPDDPDAARPTHAAAADQSSARPVAQHHPPDLAPTASGG